ncbi:hypothetical protein [Lacticaseibacillus brantae]|uniref:Uncharacterized protein n=1 Tax=Lacticaseibacillus brantae DSM 23927 TaxID=1423727 RepID=A0A0R2AXK1_9LACO|nr:hypothetical protein [Lacticaseibacillus brantae]KRM71418.1 hypothetical protein FC34_GL001530 [Lacticaseibacillus brantae DSM 23927]
MKKLLGWQFGLIFAIGWTAVEVLSVYLRLLISQKDSSSGGLIIPNMYVSPTGAAAVDWISGILGFVIVSVYFINRFTWKTASKGYLFTDVIGSTVMASGLYTVLVTIAAQFYPEVHLQWTSNWLGGSMLFLLFWLLTETILLLASAVVLGQHAQRLRAVEFQRANAPAIIFVLVVVLLSAAQYRSTRLAIPGGYYQVGWSFSTAATSTWLVVAGLIVLFALGLWLTQRLAQALDGDQSTAGDN